MIKRDKLLHFAAGSLIGISCGINPWTGIAIVAIIAFFKEAWDKSSGKGTPEWMDIVYTVAGGLCPFFAVLLSSL